ncbi:MAG TPA: hypothetical protein VK186_05110 [Candidatus Deferrimicrobium sp.]|nr:hypothetical protein [Candidatus Deferrimicrobium sp.]
MKVKFILILIAGIYLAIPRPAVAGSLQRSDLVDKNVDIVIRVSNGTDFMKALADSSYGKLWNSPEMKPFLNNQVLGDTLIKSILLSRVQESVMAEALHLNRKILSLFKGELIFAVELGKKGEKEDPENEKGKFYSLAQINETDYKAMLELAKQESKTLGEKTVSQRYTFQGVELIQDITAGEEYELIEWTAFCGNTYLNSSSRQWVEQCIVLLKKEPPTEPPGPPCIQAWLPDGFFQRLLKAEEEKNKTMEVKPGNNAAYSTVLMKALGIDKVGKFSLEWIINPSYSELNMHVQNKGGNKGVWTLISREPVPRGITLRYVPDDVLSYQVIRMNVSAFWQEIPTILETFGPQATAQFQDWLNIIGQMLQVDIGRDIVGNLDTVLTYYSCLEGNEDVSLYIWQLRNSMAMEKTLGKIFVEGSWLRNSLKGNCEILDLNGHKIYSIKTPRILPSEPAGADAPGQTGSQEPVAQQVDWVSYGVAVVDGDLVFGRLSLLRSYITGFRGDMEGRKFYKSALFTRLIERVPDNAIGYGFSDITQWLEPAANMLRIAGRPAQVTSEPGQPTPPRKGKPGEDTEPSPKSGPFDVFFNNLQYDRLPSAEFLRSFFGPWISYYQFNGAEFVVKWEFHNPPAK